MFLGFNQIVAKSRIVFIIISLHTQVLEIIFWLVNFILLNSWKKKASRKLTTLLEQKPLNQLLKVFT